MQPLHRFLEAFVEDARARLDDFNRTFSDHVPPGKRDYVEDVLGAYASTIDVLQLACGELRHLADPDGRELPEGYWTDAVTVADPHGVILFSSSSVAEVHGLAPHERIGRSVFERVHPDDLPSVKRLFQERVAPEARAARIRFRLRHRDGVWIPVEGVAQGIQQQGVIVGVVLRVRILPAGAQQASDRLDG